MIQVTAAVIRNGEKVMICKRPQGKRFGGQWEFPGGKIEAGESPQQALERELREELGTEIRAGKALAEITHVYPDISIRLTLLSARIVAGEPQLLEHTQLRWVSPREAGALDLCPADRTLLNQIMEEEHDV